MLYERPIREPMLHCCSATILHCAAFLRDVLQEHSSALPESDTKAWLPPPTAKKGRAFQKARGSRMASFRVAGGIRSSAQLAPPAGRKLGNALAGPPPKGAATTQVTTLVTTLAMSKATSPQPLSAVSRR